MWKVTVADLDLPFTKRSDSQIRLWEGPSEHNFGPGGPKFEQTNLQKFKSPGGCPGEGGMFKVGIDRRENREEMRSIID